MADGPLDEYIVLSSICILLLDDQKQTKEEEKKRSTWVRPWLARRKELGFYHQLLTQISVGDTPAFRELLWMRRLSCRVATRATISAILSRKFQFWRLFSCDFFTCRVASSRVATRAIFISRWRRDKIWKNQITSASKKTVRVAAALGGPQGQLHP